MAENASDLFLCSNKCYWPNCSHVPGNHTKVIVTCIATAKPVSSATAKCHCSWTYTNTGRLASGIMVHWDSYCSKAQRGNYLPLFLWAFSNPIPSLFLKTVLAAFATEKASFKRHFLLCLVLSHSLVRKHIIHLAVLIVMVPHTDRMSISRGWAALNYCLLVFMVASVGMCVIVKLLISWNPHIIVVWEHKY